MKFEERVALLCARALAASDDAEIHTVMEELRLVLHQRVEELRTGLLATYIVTQSSWLKTDQPFAKEALAEDDAANERYVSRTWRQLVQEISRETDRARALQLCQELAGLLQHQPATLEALEGGEA